MKRWEEGPFCEPKSPSSHAPHLPKNFSHGLGGVEGKPFPPPSHIISYRRGFWTVRI